MGWKLVPTEPTTEMIAAAWKVMQRANSPRFGPGPGFREAIPAAIAAAPASPPLAEIPAEAIAAARAADRKWAKEKGSTPEGYDPVGVDEYWRIILAAAAPTLLPEATHPSAPAAPQP